MIPSPGCSNKRPPNLFLQHGVHHRELQAPPPPSICWGQRNKEWGFCLFVFFLRDAVLSPFPLLSFSSSPKPQRACTVLSCHIVLQPSNNQVGASQTQWEMVPTHAFPLHASGSAKASCFLPSSYLSSLPRVGTRDVQLFLKTPVVWNDWRLEPYETNPALLVLSTHSKWAQIGCKFNPDLQTSANVLVNWIQPSGLFHPVSGCIVKVSLCPTCCPNKWCLKQNEDISRNEELFR